MIGLALFATAVTVQSPVTVVSPLQVEAAKLSDSTSEVKYEFITQAIKGYGVTRQRFSRFPEEQQVQIALNAYYLTSVSKALLIYSHNKELADILNTFRDQSDAERIALQFEQAYRRIFGRWPATVPVNVDQLIDRMLEEQTVR